MRLAAFAATLLFAGPAVAQSQNPSAPSSDGAYTAPNLSTPQAQSNMQMNPPEASQDMRSGQATSIPNPTLGGSTPVPQSPSR